jgi:hypothetical protein
MSTTIAVTVRNAPRAGEVLAALAISDAVLSGPRLDHDAPWPDSVRRLYRPKLSTRALELSYDGDACTMSVRILALASRDDLALAIAFVHAFASCGGATRVSAEPFGDLALDALAARYDDAWWAHETAVSIVALRQSIAAGGTAKISGPRRPFHVGPETTAKLGDDAARWLDALRTLQWHPAPTAVVYTAKAESDGREISLVLWKAEPIVIPEVEYVAVVPVSVEGEDTILVRPSSVPAIAGASRCTRLDEIQLALAAFTPIEFAVVHTVAKRHESLP